MAMCRLSEHRTGAPSGAVRFVCHLLLGYFAFESHGLYTIVRDNIDELLAPPLDRSIFAAQTLAGIGGIACFIYNFLGWIPTCMSHGVFLTIFGFLDCVVLAIIGTAIGMQSKFVPLIVTECNQVQKASNETTDERFLFFYRVGQTNKTAPTFGRDECNQAQSVWYVGLVIFILYSLSAFCNLMPSCSSRRPQYGRWQQRSRRRYHARHFWSSAVETGRTWIKSLRDMLKIRRKFSYPRVHITWSSPTSRSSPQKPATIHSDSATLVSELSGSKEKFSYPRVRVSGWSQERRSSPERPATINSDSATLVSEDSGSKAKF